MKQLYRNLDLPIDDATLPDLEHLTKEDILSAVRVSSSPSAATRIINRLHNRQKERKAKKIKAFQLVNSGFEPMAEIQFMIENYDILQGRITNAVAVSNGDGVIITILGGLYDVESSWSVERDCEVRVWRKESDPRNAPSVDYDRVMSHGYLSVEYIAEHLTTFFGKYISVKNRAGGRLRGIEVKADDPDAYHFTLGTSKVRLGKNEVVDVKQESHQPPDGMRPGPYPWGVSRPRPPASPFLATAFARNAGKTHLQDTLRTLYDTHVVSNDRPDYQGDSWWYYNNRTYSGKTVQLGSGDPAKSGVKGLCTQVTYEDGKLIFVIDGRIYKRNRYTTLKVWDKKER